VRCASNETTEKQTAQKMPAPIIKSPSNNNNHNKKKNENQYQQHQHGGGGGGGSLSAPVTPVGITIARKRKQNNQSGSKSLKKEEEQRPKTTTKSSDTSGDTKRKAFRSESSSKSDAASSATKSNKASSSSSSYQKPVSSWSIFWEGSAVYFTCLIVPTVIAYILRHHEYRKQQLHPQTSSLTLWSSTLDLACSLALEYIWTERVREAAAHYLCPLENGPFVYYLGADYMPNWSWCPKPPPDDESSNNNVVLLSPDASWTDLRLVAALSLTLALIRIAIVRLVLGGGDENIFTDSTRMRALIKCKSSHLLSSNYELTPCGTPVLLRKVLDSSILGNGNFPMSLKNNNVVGSSPASSSPGVKNISSLQLPFSFSQEASLKDKSGFVPSTISLRKKNHGGENETDDDDGDLDDDDSVNIGLFLDTSEHSSLSRDASVSAPLISPRRRQLSNKDLLPSIPPTPPLSPASNTRAANATATQSRSQSAAVLQEEDGPDSPLEYLTNSLLRRCHSTGSGTGGGGIQGLDTRSPPPRRRQLSPQRAATAAVSPMAYSPAIRSAIPARRPKHLYAAPRLATAVFRLAYTTVAAILAWHSFHTANFWPWYVGGAWNSTAVRGSRSSGTAHCWDLNGGAVSVGILDSDFDLRNTVLRRYFLLQASYHFHSTAFHVGSCILLMIQNYRSKDAANPQSPANASWSSSSIWRVSTTSYLRSLLHHALALLTIATAYIFSSLRRLVAIGMFAFDVSSWFLHLLQICINAKSYKDDDDDDYDNHNNGRFSLRHLLTASRIQIFHRFLVLPAFVLCRFGVWGALWYSALTESRAWLQQLEKTLFPNAALLLQSLWNACMVGLFVANIIHLYRLLYHPHLKRIHGN
jgi:TLC domain